MITINIYVGLVPLPPFLNRWQFRNPPLVLASSNCTFDCMIVYGIRLSPNDYVLVLCFGLPFQEVPIFPFSVFDFLRLPGQYTVIVSTYFKKKFCIFGFEPAQLMSFGIERNSGPGQCSLFN